MQPCAQVCRTGAGQGVAQAVRSAKHVVASRVTAHTWTFKKNFEKIKITIIMNKSSRKISPKNTMITKIAAKWQNILFEAPIETIYKM